MPALTSGRYHIKWTQLADLPVPLHDAYVALHYHKLFVTGESPVEDALYQVYVYDTNANQWAQLPPSGHYYGIPHIIGEKLAIVGGRLSATKKMTNKVSTFDEDSQTWTSYYPDLLSVRSKPGVVNHLEHVIVAGGGRPTAEDDDTPVVQDDIEVLNWIENSHWSKISIKLPVAMYGFTPTIYDDYLIIVGYNGANVKVCNDAYKIPVANATASIDTQDNTDIPTKWTKLTVNNPYRTALVPSSSPPVIVGGKDTTYTATPDIKVFDNSNKSWKKIGSLSSARCGVAVTAVYNNAIIVIGGYTTGGDKGSRKSSGLTLVELGQAELLPYTSYL